MTSLINCIYIFLSLSLSLSLSVCLYLSIHLSVYLSLSILSLPLSHTDPSHLMWLARPTNNWQAKPALITNTIIAKGENIVSNYIFGPKEVEAIELNCISKLQNLLYLWCWWEFFLFLCFFFIFLELLFPLPRPCSHHYKTIGTFGKIIRNFGCGTSLQPNLYITFYLIVPSTHIHPSIYVLS